MIFRVPTFLFDFFKCSLTIMGNARTLLLLLTAVGLTLITLPCNKIKSTIQRGIEAGSKYKRVTEPVAGKTTISESILSRLNSIDSSWKGEGMDGTSPGTVHSSVPLASTCTSQLAKHNDDACMQNKQWSLPNVNDPLSCDVYKLQTGTPYHQLIQEIHLRKALKKNVISMNRFKSNTLKLVKLLISANLVLSSHGHLFHTVCVACG